MKTYQELLQTETYWKLKIQNDLFNALENYLKETGMTRSQFAKQLGVSKGYISQVLNGDFNHKISKLIELSLAIGKAPILTFENLEEVAFRESQEKNTHSDESIHRNQHVPAQGKLRNAYPKVHRTPQRE